VPHPIEEFAAEAYAAGVAHTGGVPTDRVIAGAGVAVALAIEHADNPDVLEATINLGRLEGLWSRLFRRREDLIRHHTGLVTTAWRDVLAAELITDAIRALRRDDQARNPDRWKTAVTATAAALLASLRSRPQWTVLRQAFRDAIAAAQAEGATAAAVLTADQNGQQPPDWDTEFDATLTAITGRYQLWADADTWTGKLLDRAQGDLTRALGDDPGVADEQLADSASQALTGDDAQGVDFTVDWAMTAAAGAGALAAYAAMGQPQANWITVGDGKVCPACETNEARSPYPLIEFPTLPAHPGCRCQAVPV